MIDEITLSDIKPGEKHYKTDYTVKVYYKEIDQEVLFTINTNIKNAIERKGTEKIFKLIKMCRKIPNKKISDFVLNKLIDSGENKRIKNEEYIVEHYNEIKENDKELIEIIPYMNSILNKYSIIDIKKFIRNSMGSSWYEEEEGITISDDEYYKNLDFEEGYFNTDYEFQFWFNDNCVLYFGHVLCVCGDKEGLNGVDLHG